MTTPSRPACYDGSFLLSTSVCRLQSHRSFAMPPEVSVCVCVSQFVTSTLTWVSRSITVSLYWSAEKAKCSSLPKIGRAVHRVMYRQRKWETVWKRKAPRHNRADWGNQSEKRVSHWGNISVIITFDILFDYLKESADLNAGAAKLRYLKQSWNISQDSSSGI